MTTVRAASMQMEGICQSNMEHEKIVESGLERTYPVGTFQSSGLEENVA